MNVDNLKEGSGRADRIKGGLFGAKFTDIDDMTAAEDG